MPQEFAPVSEVKAAISGYNRRERIEVMGHVSAPRWRRRDARAWLAMLSASVRQFDVIVGHLESSSPSRSLWSRLVKIDFYVTVVGPAYGVRAYLDLLEHQGAA